MPYTKKEPQHGKHQNRSDGLYVAMSAAEIISQIKRSIYNISKIRDVSEKKKQESFLIKTLSLEFSKRRIKANEYTIINGVLFFYVIWRHTEKVDIFFKIFNKAIRENYLFKERKRSGRKFSVLNSIIIEIASCCEEGKEKYAKEFCKILIKYDAENIIKDHDFALCIFAKRIFKYEYIVEEIVRLFTASDRPNKEKGLKALKEFLQNVIDKVLEKNLSELVPKIKEYLAGEKVKEYLGDRELNLRFGEQEETLDLGDISCGVYTAPPQVRKRKRQPSYPKPKSVGGSDEAKLIPNSLDSSTVQVLGVEKPNRTIWSFFSITTFFSRAKRANGKGTNKAKECVAKSV